MILQCEKIVTRGPGGKSKRPEKCNRPAHTYDAKGASFTARATLCDRHKGLAIREGFTLKPIEGT